MIFSLSRSVVALVALQPADSFVHLFAQRLFARPSSFLGSIVTADSPFVCSPVPWFTQADASAGALSMGGTEDLGSPVGRHTRLVTGVQPDLQGLLRVDDGGDPGEGLRPHWAGGARQYPVGGGPGIRGG